MKHVAVVGGGLGGLAAAIRLRAAGARVTLFEKNGRVGGKMNLVEQDGFTFDTGPSLFTMPWVVDELLAVAGYRREELLEIVPVDPTCRYRFADGQRFDAWADLAALVGEIERLSPPDVAGFFRFMAFAARIYQAAAEPFLLEPFAGLRTMLQPRLLRDALKIAPFQTVDQAVRRFFRHPHLRQIFNRYATYNGSSPYRSPATFCIIPYVELAQGGWYVRGGMYRLAAALERVAGELGVEIRLNSPVSALEFAGRRARGVRLADGSSVAADHVVVNADALYALDELIPPAKAPSHPLSCSGFVLLLGVHDRFPQLAHHNIFFSADYPAEFRAIFERGAPAPDPTIYVAATARSDAGHAPPGMLNLFVLVNAPPLGRVNWEREAPAYRDLIVSRLERAGLDGLSAAIVSERCLTPADLAAMTNAHRGALYGPASHGLRAAFLRPRNRPPGLRGVTLAGGATHPGGGIPLVLLSGKAAARWALEELGE
ncbi:MAG TPA: phytoene desaturase family protein [Herpetosiphonaceae bacterium]